MQGWNDWKMHPPPPTTTLSPIKDHSLGTIKSAKIEVDLVESFEGKKEAAEKSSASHQNILDMEQQMDHFGLNSNGHFDAKELDVEYPVITSSCLFSRPSCLPNPPLSRL